MRAEWRVEPGVDWRPAAELRRRLARIGGYRTAHLVCWVGLWLLSPWSFPAAIVAILISPRPRWLREGVAEGDESLDLLRELPSPVQQFPVDIAIFRENAFAGQDRGILRVVDGWLTFQGWRTEWSLSTSDAHLIGATLLPVTSLAFTPLSKAVRLREVEPPTQIAIVLRPTRLKGLADFTAELETWRIAPPADGESVLPPLDFHPQVRYQLFVWRARIVGKVVRTALFSFAVLMALARAFDVGSSASRLLVLGLTPLVLGVGLLAACGQISATFTAIANLRAAIRVWGIAPPIQTEAARVLHENTI